MGEKLLTEKELCQWLQIGRATAWRWRKEGMPYLKRGNIIRFDKDKVQEWLEKKNGQN